MKLTLVLLFVVASSWCFEEQIPETAQKYCGKVLADTMASVCYFSNSVKRDASWWLSADAMRGKRGIVDDCCFSPCSLDVLRSYC
ncbi:hypothetical protein PYW08_015055 [Mythimna loreyi]|uniref:Uncharacterized protein n=1 Tax=Mythimna loreyi TaxID=667449 RepID=A0ACC2R3Q5_9NEOP|nr:hypothetical protein PYW08_015055 [Mythimna loreyi]